MAMMTGFINLPMCVTNMLLESQFPSFNTVLHNAKVIVLYMQLIVVLSFL